MVEERRGCELLHGDQHHQSSAQESHRLLDRRTDLHTNKANLLDGGIPSC